MKRIQKWTALLLACALGASLLAGCSAGEGAASSIDFPNPPSDGSAAQMKEAIASLNLS